MSSRPIPAGHPIADFMSLVEAMRPRQWTKNLIVIAPAFFHFKPKPEVWWPSIALAALFCLISSAFYLINDVADRPADRLHPRKRLRPIAAGRVSATQAVFLAGLLAISAFGLVTRLPWQAGLLLLVYCLLQVLYNLWAKYVVLLDLLFIAAGFVVRAGAGASAGQIPLSPWFLLCVGLLAVFLGIEKRKAEITHLAALQGVTRAVLHDYSERLLDKMEQVMVSGGVITYALWSAGPQLNGAPTSAMMLTLPAVIYGAFRYQWLSEQGRDTERPEDLLLTDRPMLWTALCWVTVACIVLAGHSAGLFN